MKLLVEIALVAAAVLTAALLVKRIPARRAARRAVARARPRGPEQLTRVERLVATAPETAIGTYGQLRPVLTEIVGARLLAHGTTLERLAPEAGVELLGEPLWELVRPDRPAPAQWHGPGTSLPELESMLDAIERL